MSEMLFREPEGQILEAFRLNRERGWGFEDRVFLELYSQINFKPIPSPFIQALEICLPAENGVSAMTRTLYEMWNILKLEHPRNWFWEEIKPDRLRLLGGKEAAPGIRFQIINFRANLGKAPHQARREGTSPGLGILSIAALNPEWVRKTGSKGEPRVWLPGLEMNMPGNPWGWVPRFGKNSNDEISLFALWGDEGAENFSVPEIAYFPV